MQETLQWVHSKIGKSVDVYQLQGVYCMRERDVLRSKHLRETKQSGRIREEDTSTMIGDSWAWKHVMK